MARRRGKNPDNAAHRLFRGVRGQPAEMLAERGRDLKVRIRAPTVGDMPAGRTYFIKNRIKGKGVMPGSPYGCHGNMAVFFCGGGREHPFRLKSLRGKNCAGESGCVWFMAFITSAINMLKVLVIAIGGGLAVWGIINLLEGYGNDNPGAKSQGIKQLMAGGGIALIGVQLIPLLANLFATP